MTRNAAAALALLLATSAAAQTRSAAPAALPAGLEAAFKATVLSTYPDGRTAKLWLEPEGVYRGQGRRGKPSSGRWSIKGSQICLKQSRPIAVPMSYCTALPPADARSWTGKAVTGEPIRIELIPGRP